MNKAELVDRAAEAASEALGHSVTKKEVDAILTATMEAVMDAVAQGETVTLVGFGAWKARDRAQREGRNPKTGEAMTIPATRVPAFVPGKGFKAAVAEATPTRELVTA